MKCLETRRREDGTKWRRYRADDGTIVKTVEMPVELLEGIVTAGRAQDRVAQRQRAIDRDKVRQAAVRLVNEDGWKPLAVASEMGLAVRTVHRWAAEAAFPLRVIG